MRKTSNSVDGLKNSVSSAVSSKKTSSILGPLIILSLGWVMIYADRLSIPPVMTLIKSEFGLSFASSAGVMTIYFVAYTAIGIPVSILAMRYGYKRVMIYFLWIATVSFGLAGLFGYTYSILLVFIAIHGLGAGAFYPTAFRISTQLSTKETRGLSSAIIETGMGFGSILGLIIAGPVLDFFPNWQAVLLLLSIPTAVVVLLLMKYIPRIAPEDSPRVHLSEFGHLLRNRNFVSVTTAMFCAVYGYWVILTWAPSFLQQTMHLSVLSSGVATAVFAATAIPSALLMGRYSDRVGRKKVSLMILPLSGLTILLIGFNTNLVIFLLAIAAYGFVGKLAFDPVAVAWIGDMMQPGSVGISLAVFSTLSMAASIFAPYITGVFADLTGTLTSGFFFGAFIVFLGSVVLLFSKNSK